MDAEFIEQQEDFKRLVYFCGFYEVSFPGNGAQYPDLLQVFISFFSSVPRYFKFKTQFIDGRKQVVFADLFFTYGFNNRIGNLQIPGSS